jgi:hypothetical protein
MFQSEIKSESMNVNYFNYMAKDFFLTRFFFVIFHSKSKVGKFDPNWQQRRFCGTPTYGMADDDDGDELANILINYFSIRTKILHTVIVQLLHHRDIFKFDAVFSYDLGK